MLSIALSSYATFFVVGNDTVDELEVEDFMGLWYEVYTDDRVSSTIEEKGFCVTSFYRERDQGFISVRYLL